MLVRYFLVTCHTAIWLIQLDKWMEMIFFSLLGIRFHLSVAGWDAITIDISIAGNTKTNPSKFFFLLWFFIVWRWTFVFRFDCQKNSIRKRYGKKIVEAWHPGEGCRHGWSKILAVCKSREIWLLKQIFFSNNKGKNRKRVNAERWTR